MFICGTELEGKFKHRRESTGKERVVHKGGFYLDMGQDMAINIADRGVTLGTTEGARRRFHRPRTRLLSPRLRQRVKIFETSPVLTVRPKRVDET
ncbi:hypothetical protein BDM02DRAFT_3124364 [Thelephora ganbajun]|uniref:Uncharacterized protein n=1 Tax=Thelephora ganbajun TaxID=370292 RepID=A0ACB6Z0G3_THEGA|nr:hypothetical protein BDM02DRAFT_3124364 [Thelephora ganbajun]